MYIIVKNDREHKNDIKVLTKNGILNVRSGQLRRMRKNEYLSDKRPSVFKKQEGAFHLLPGS